MHDYDGEGWNVTGDLEAMKRGNVVYIAEPMEGIQDGNRPMFYAAEEFLQHEGLLVLNPARLPVGMPGKRYMPLCLAMLEQADVIALLPDWLKSKGAYIEQNYAMYQKKDMLFMRNETAVDGDA